MKFRYNKLRNEGELDNIGGATYLENILNNVSAAAVDVKNVKDYIDIITEKAVRREVIKVSNKILSIAYFGEIELKSSVKMGNFLSFWMNS